MSEDEQDLVRNIIRVVICPKTDLESPDRILPKILVTDHSQYDLTHIELRSDLSSLAGSEKDGADHLDITNEFQAEPSELLPESYLSYVGSCRELIGHICHYSESRVSADQWIEQFDKEIDDAIRESEALEENERQEREREEERLRRLRRRAMMRKINKPLSNPRPGLGSSSHSSHQRVCHLPLETLKKMLVKYRPKLASRFEAVRSGPGYSDYLEENDVTEILRSEFARYILKRIKETSGELSLEGKCFENFKKCQERKEKDTERQPRTDGPSKSSDLNGIISVSRKETFTKVSFKQLEKQYRLKWRYSKSRGVLEEKFQRRRKGISERMINTCRRTPNTPRFLIKESIFKKEKTKNYVKVKGRFRGTFNRFLSPVIR